jgi:glycosyltransferase involved in cell wall biosynthesis
MQVSIILSTYNRPDALSLVLRSLANQTQLDFSVIIADDGSSSDTREIIENLIPKLPYSCQHIWQSDQGFRLAMARNKAVAQAKADYLVFLDGDCIPRPDFVARHRQLAEKGYFVAGNRILLQEKFTTYILFNQIEIGSWSQLAWFMPYLHGDINRFLPLINLADAKWRKLWSHKWQGAKTCNLGVWRQDLVKINGFNEEFTGWGHEDAEFVVRLLHSGIKRKDGRFAVPVLHLWHVEADRSYEKNNYHRLEHCIKSKQSIISNGINQYLML